MLSHRNVVRNFLALGSGEIISRLIAFAAIIYVARILGAEDYGVIAFAVGVNLYFSRIADFAIDWIGAKEIARHRESFHELAAAITGTRIALSIVVAAIAIVVSQLVLPAPEKDIVSLYLLSMIPIAANIKWIHMGLENTRPVGVSRVLGETLGLIIVLVVMTHAAMLWVPPIALISSEMLMAVYLIWVLKKRGYTIGLSLNLKVSLPIFKAAVPLLINLLLGLLIYNADLIFLRIFHDSAQVGFYAAAYMLISFINNLGLSYGMTLLPTMTRYGKHSPEEAGLYQTAQAHIFAVSFPLMIGGYLLASQVILLGFGQGYFESAIILQLLMITLPLSMIRNVPWAALIAHGRQDLLMRAIIFGVMSNITLNLLLVPKFAMIGAAVATIATECVIAYFIHKYAHEQDLPKVPFARFWRPLVAGLIMGLVLFEFSTASIFINILIGVASYLVGIILTGGIRFHRHTLPSLHI